MDNIKATVKEYILTEFLPGESPESLTDSVSLITGGILDSIATMRLVVFLEEKYGVQFEAHEMSPDKLDSLTAIAETIRSKLRASG